MAKERTAKYNVIVYDLMFLLSFLFTIASSMLVFLDLVFLIPTAISFSIWLILTLIVLRKRGVSLKRSLFAGKLVSGLPTNRRLRLVYIGALLTSLMIFFGLMIIAKEIYLLFAFIVWIFVGSLVMQELGEGTEPKEAKKLQRP